MTEDIVYLNGKFLHREKAKVSIFDRGFLMADGVYEVIPVVRGVLVNRKAFWERFERSMRALDLLWPLEREALEEMLRELIRHNALEEGGVYLQVSRGVSFERIFGYPEGIAPTLMAFCFSKAILDSPEARRGVTVATVEDIRWKRRDIKSIALLGQCMAKEAAKKPGAYEGWMVEEGFVTEGVASSAYIVKKGRIITRPLTNAILPGIRRKVLLELAPAHGIEVELRPFTVAEAYEADEAFLSSATTLVYPVVVIDGRKVGDGRPGPVTEKMRRLYIETLLREAAGG